MVARAIDVTLHVERSERGVRGTVRVEDEPAREFSGWLGLLAALEALVERSDRERAP
jgi:hypothetical protein